MFIRVQTNEEAVVDGVIDGPATDGGHDEVHAEVEHQEEAGHRLHRRVRHVLFNSRPTYVRALWSATYEYYTSFTWFFQEAHRPVASADAHLIYTRRARSTEKLKLMLAAGSICSLLPLAAWTAG